jgi:iron complex transport system substrate-binding protein
VKTRFLCLLLSLLALVPLASCAGEAGTPPMGTAHLEEPAGERYFTDSAGRVVAVSGTITRIVPSSSLAQAVLFAIAPDMLVGLASRWSASAGGLIDRQYLDLPYFGSLYASADLNVEELALTGPQLIVDIGEAKDSVAEDLDTLQAQTGIPAVYISASLAHMPETYRTLGELLGREERGEALAQFCERVYSRTISILEQVGGDKVRALYVMGGDGLKAVARGSYHGELLDLLADNVAVVDNPASKGTGNEVTMEQIMLWDPDFVLFAPDSIYDTVTEIQPWNQVSAIASGAYVRVPDAPMNWMGMPPSVQRYLGLIWLTAELYPEYSDYDVTGEIMEFYRLFFGCTLTEAQVEAITDGAFLRR